MNFLFDDDDMNDVAMLLITRKLLDCSVEVDESDKKPKRQPRKLNKDSTIRSAYKTVERYYFTENRI